MSTIKPVSHIFLVLLVAAVSLLGSVLTIPNQAVSAKPLSDFTNCASQTEIPEPECNALVALYNNTSGEDWFNPANWLFTDTPCNWYGVTCNSGTVTGLALGSNGLYGAIPPELDDLTNLASLDLFNNQLFGSIPAELGNLTNLETLYLDHTELDGEIPASFVNLTSLTNLALACGLTSTDPSVISFIDGILGTGWDDTCPLTNDDFDDAFVIHSFPYGNTQNTAPATTAVDDPYFPCGSTSQGSNSVWYRYTPASAKLLTVSTSGSNYDTMLAVWTGSRGSLVNVGCNDDASESTKSFLSIIIPGGQTYYIEAVGYSNNSGNLSFGASVTEPFVSCAAQTEIPEAECDALVALYNSTDGAYWDDNSNWLLMNTPCSWEGVYCENGTNVTGLSLASNNLSGVIPPGIGNLTNLPELDLSNNQLTGSIPVELTNLTNLTALRLAGNQLSGSIPPGLGNMPQLKYLFLSDNQLSGSIPAELDNLANLTTLDLSNNLLSGSIPPELGNMTQLQSLDLGGNQLSGSIPTEIGNLVNLLDMDLSQNQLSSPIPPELGDMAQLQYLYLNNNQLSGSIPPETGTLVNLSVLYLSKNQLSGPIPPEMGNLAQLESLYLNDNQLSGEFPASFTALASLDDLVFDQCQGLTSSDPEVIAFLDGLVGPGWQCIPIITNVSPYYGPPAGGTIVTLTGRDFTGASSVTFGGTSATFTVNSATKITATAPAHPIGAVEITVTNPYGIGTSAFTYTLPFSGCASVSQIPPSECDALVALYNSTDGAHWNNRAGWLQTNTPCIWHGVSCAGGTNVTGLSLGLNNLYGPIPPEVGSLTQLTKLLVDYNQLSGPIPAEIGNLTNITNILLDKTQMAGEIPASFVNLVNLTVLTLNCGLTSSDQDVINFIDNILGPDWDNECYLDENFNNDLYTARLINPFPYTDMMATSLAGTAWDDPIFPCGSHDQGENSLWYTYTPARAGRLTLNTFGSDYDTMLAVWTGRRGSLVNAGCNDNANAGTEQSQLVITVSAGQTYYVEVAGTYIWGDLVFNASVTPILTRTFTSIAIQDGWILESSETSKKGGTLNSNATTFNLGDDATKKQYLGILSFNTGAALPDNAVITSVILKVKKRGITGGGNPLTTFQGFMVDIKKGPFGTAALQTDDFQTTAGKSYGPFKPTPVNNWYSINLTGAQAYINKLSTASGLTQIRLRFKLDDNNNAIANLLSLYSGNAPALNRPQLVITYYVP